MSAGPMRDAAAATPSGAPEPSSSTSGASTGGSRAATGTPTSRAVARGGPLTTLNPLAKLAAPLPAMIVVVFSRDLLLPAALIVLALVVLLVGARLSPGIVAALVVGTPVAALVLGVSFGIWVDPASAAVAGVDGPAASTVLFGIGDWQFTLAAYLVGVATALRVLAVLMLSLIAGLTSTGTEFVRAAVQNLRVPYRIGYTALAALRFVPRFGHELEIIRAAHRVRGTVAGRGPIAALRRGLGTAVPLLASAIRHAERVALAMDARAFGAHRTRTERYLMPWRARDTVFVVAFVAASAVIVWLVWATLAR
ncbi:energy-coupling factor transporter transmembrane protein EcfT [Agromyces endophyticus]|uniref:energy-coupling factor transporter transmembrane component T n=1 Tax=Agromyces sp. H17E-10 TaxID=2932244 RepID=UPI001FCFC6B2|nr:energy-coupling factor transporter transmembrane component T [Agromyces sp. H17E-10]UOQ87951.1 energy-coupling factor transporter transmembrane protein EcfT [Agromyces sp. H17E-10]